ncbi:MAG: hypothetical protein PHE24_05770 [Patescibacteria group bacterium]|nr:hypothetical protein [Patescibacteria group bacterium]
MAAKMIETLPEVSICVDCDDPERKALLKQVIIDGGLVKTVFADNSHFTTDLIIVDQISKAFEAREFINQTFIYIPADEKIKYALPANVWVLTIDKLLDSLKTAHFIAALSEQKKCREGLRQ